MADGDKTFSLQSSTSEFSERSKDIFSSLNALETKHKQYEQEHQSDAIIKNDPDADTFETITSSFKKPRSAPKRPYPKSKQDFKKSHDNTKWTHYSLADVSDHDLSDSANKKAALEFLHERKKLRETEDNCEGVNINENACSKSKFKFGIIPKLNSQKDSLSRPTVVSSKLMASTDFSFSTDRQADENCLSEQHDVGEESGARNAVFKKSHVKKHQKMRERLSDDEDDDGNEERQRNLYETKMKQKNRRTVGKAKESKASSTFSEEAANAEYIEACEVLSDDEDDAAILDDDNEYGL